VVSVSSSASGAGLCSASASQVIGSTWPGGGLVTIVISNIGATPISSLTITLEGSFSSWNLVASGADEYTFEGWAFPIAVGSSYSSAGYTFSGSEPIISIVSVDC